MPIVVPELALVAVPTLRPLENFHTTTGAGDRTACGLSTHGWYPLTASAARANACTACTACFPARAGR